ncbi:MAG: TRAP transporter small permease subunit [Gammaproteobacteria bacterium]|nr:TRAP transporter small permease subunit [Gammaproteobacteria bacterium]
MKRLIQILDNIAEKTGRFISWFSLLMVIFTFAVVVLRYGFDLGWIGLQESISYWHSLVFMLGAAYTLKRDTHVRVDIFYQNFGRKGQAWVNLLGSLFLLFPVCLFIFWISWEYVGDSWAVKEGSAETGGLPWLYLLKTLLLIMPVLLILQGLAQALRAILILRGQFLTEEHDSLKI